MRKFQTSYRQIEFHVELMVANCNVLIDLFRFALGRSDSEGLCHQDNVRGDLR